LDRSRLCVSERAWCRARANVRSVWLEKAPIEDKRIAGSESRDEMGEATVCNDGGVVPVSCVNEHG
jgi:hypothetical protein